MTPASVGRPDASPLAPEGLEEARAGQTSLAQALRLCLSSPLPMMLWWPERQEPVFNPVWESLTGAEPADLHARIWQAVQADARDVLRTGQAFTCDVSNPIGPDRPPSDCGKYVLHPLFDEDGQAVGVLMIGSLCHPQPRAGWREHMNYAAVIESMDLGFCRIKVVDSGAGELLDYVFLEVNPAYELHTGLSDLVGRRVSEVVTQREPFWSEAIREVLASGAALQTTMRVNNDERTFEVGIMRIGGPDSREVAMLVKNITAQTEATRLLKLSGERARQAAAQDRAESSRLSAVLDASPAAVIVVNADNQITLVNTQARQAWGDMPQAGSVAWVGHWADGGPQHGQRLRPSQWPLSRALLGHSSREIITITSPLDGKSRRTFLCSASPIWDLNLQIEGAVVVAVDITDRIEAERALKDNIAQRDLFLAMLAHELRNPLAPIQMAAELIGRADLPPEDVAQNIAIVSRQARHLQGLVDDLLDTARVQRQLLELDLHVLDLHPLIEEAVEQNQVLISSLGHALAIEMPAGPLPLKGDRKRIVQILVNLLNNAAKYTPAGGQLQIRVQTDGAWLEISVIDNGQGMSEELLRKAFDLFVQAERTPDRQAGGLGLGLSLVKKLVRLHGGLISAHSDGPDQGCCFTVRLPALPPDTDLPAPAPASDDRALAALRILVVDDNEDAAQTLADYLKACGHACEMAHNAEQALTLAVAPQVYILDIGLPGMDGRQLAQALRKREAESSAAAGRALILALSGYAQPQEQEAALAAGFDHYLVKPVDLDRLSALLQSWAMA